MKFAMKALAFAVMLLVVANAFTPLPLSTPKLTTSRKSQLRHTMCSSNTMPPKNKTKTDIETDLYFRMEEWRVLTSAVIQKAAGEETFFEVDQ